MSQNTTVHYVWPMQTVYAVQRLRAHLDIDRLTVERYGDDALDSAKSELVKVLQRLAESHAVMPHAMDFAFHREDDASPFTLRLTAAWRPESKDVELHGGPADGQVFTLQRVGDPFLVPTLPSPMTFVTDETSSPALIPHHLQYEIAGWHEGSRRWVYRPRASRPEAAS